MTAQKNPWKSLSHTTSAKVIIKEATEKSQHNPTQPKQNNSFAYN